ncbi:MAG: hypothetical protein ACRDKB_12235 [Actinomycetota bacterium]
MRDQKRVDDVERGSAMRIEDRRGESLSEATVSLDDSELVDLLEGIADVVEGKRDHLHFAQMGGAQLVVRRATSDDPDPLGRQMDWWLGPLVLGLVIFVIVGVVTVVRWAAGLL